MPSTKSSNNNNSDSVKLASLSAKKSQRNGGKKKGKTLAAIRAARALRIYDQLRAKAPPGTYIVLANNRPAEQPGQSSNFLDVYHVARPRVIYHGSPADAASRKLSVHDMDKAKVKRAFGKAARWMRYMTIYTADGQVQATIDLGDMSTVSLAPPPPAPSQQQQLNASKTQTGDTNSGVSGYLGWLKKNWKLCAIVVAVLLLVAGGAYWYWKR